MAGGKRSVNNRLVVMSVFAATLAGFYFYADGGIDQMSSILNSETSDPSASQHQPGEQAIQVSEQMGPALNPLSEVTPDSITDSFNRPLFNKTRQPRPAAQPEQPEAPPVEQAVVEETPDEEPAEDLPQPGDYSLLAVASGPGRRVAAVKINESNLVVYVSQGQAIAKWEVLDVGEREVRIGRDEKSITLKLFAGEPALEDPEQQQQQ